jgi:hypothetical protein
MTDAKIGVPIGNQRELVKRGNGDGILTRTGTALQTLQASNERVNVVSVGRNIGIPTTKTIVETAIHTKAGVTLIVWIWRVVIFEV